MIAAALVSPMRGSAVSSHSSARFGLMRKVVGDTAGDMLSCCEYTMALVATMSHSRPIITPMRVEMMELLFPRLGLLFEGDAGVFIAHRSSFRLVDLLDFTIEVSHIVIGLLGRSIRA